MTYFVVFIPEPQIGSAKRNDFALLRPALTSVFQQHSGINITMEGAIGIYCEANDEQTIDQFEKALPAPWKIDRTQYQVEPL